MKHQFDMFDNATFGVTSYSVASGSLDCTAPNQVVETMLRQRCDMAMSELEPTFIPVGYEVGLLANHYSDVLAPEGQSVSSGSQPAAAPEDLATRRFATQRLATIEDALGVDELRKALGLPERETSVRSPVSAQALEATVALPLMPCWLTPSAPRSIPSVTST